MQFSTADDSLRLGAQDGEFVIDIRSAFMASVEGTRSWDSHLGPETRIPLSMEQFLEAGEAALEVATQALQFARSVRAEPAWKSCAYNFIDIKGNAPLLN